MGGSLEQEAEQNGYSDFPTALDATVEA